MEEVSSRAPAAGQPLLRRIHLALHDLVELSELARSRAAKQQNLHPTDLACLSYLRRVGLPVSPKQIAAHLNLTSGTATALLDRLEGAGYTRRLPNPEDRRSVLIELDFEQAREPLARLAEIEAGYAAVTQTFSEQDLSAISRFLDEINLIAKKLVT